MYRLLVNTSLEQRSACIPAIEEHVGATTIDYSQPWMFQTLPGVKSKPSEHRWCSEGKQLNEALVAKEALALAHEPLDVLNGGPDFYQNLSAFLKEQTGESDVQALAVSALFGIAVLSGNHDSIVEVLTVIDEFQRGSDNAEAVFAECKGQLEHYVTQIKKVFDA